MKWLGFLHARATRWIAGGSVFAGIAGIVLGQTLLAPTYEVLYSGSMSVAHCVAVENRQLCSFVYELSLGNTGKKVQDGVRIQWPLNMQHWGVETTVSDIIASAQQTPQPQIRPAFEADKTVYTISGLMPNVMVRFWARCLVCTPQQAHALRNTRVVVEARGAVSEADPRVSALLHGMMNVLRLIGIFY